MGKRFALTGPLEKDIQAWILASLGAERRRYEVSRKTGKGSWVRTGLYVSRDGQAYWWRANSGRRVYDYTTKAGETGRGLFKAAPKGTADILGVVCGRSVALEVKRYDEQQSAEQREWQAMHEAAGGVYAVVTSPSEARGVVARIREQAERLSASVFGVAM